MKNHILKSKMLLFISIIIIYIFISLIVNIYELPKTIFNNSYNFYLIIFLTILSVLMLLLSRKIKKHFLCFLLLDIYVLISFLITNNIFNDYAKAFIQMFWAIPFILSFFCLKDRDDIYVICNYFGYLSIIMCILYIFGKFSNVYTTQTINSAYYTLFSLPFIFFIKNKFLKIISILLLTFSVLISGKTTIILAFSVIVFLYYILNNKLSIKSFISILLLILAFWALYTLSINYFNKDFIMEILESAENGGNGRIDIYKRLINIYSNSSLFKQLFGYGCGGAAKLVNISAHNDFIEVLVDYGLLGFTLYLNIYRLLIKELKKIKSSQIYQTMLFSIIIFVFVSFGSNIIFVPTYFIFLTFFWGLIFKYNILTLGDDT